MTSGDFEVSLSGKISVEHSGFFQVSGDGFTVLDEARNGFLIPLLEHVVDDFPPLLGRTCGLNKLLAGEGDVVALGLLDCSATASSSSFVRSECWLMFAALPFAIRGFFCLG